MLSDDRFKKIGFMFTTSVVFDQQDIIVKSLIEQLDGSVKKGSFFLHGRCIENYFNVDLVICCTIYSLHIHQDPFLDFKKCNIYFTHLCGVQYILNH